MNSNPINDLLVDKFKSESEEVYEVAVYVLSTLAIQEAVLQGLVSNSEVKGIPANAYLLMSRFNDGLTKNNFWISNYAPIKVALTNANIKLETMRTYIKIGQEKNSKHAFEHAKSILLSRFDALTTVAFLFKGVEFAEEFDFLLRTQIELSPEHQDFFRRNGL